jgi:endonuclease/exonuclease/phosphatase family metal-dependent hydrolase
MGVFLLLQFLNAFTFTYPYTLPSLRGLGWAVYLVAALLAGLPLLRPARTTAVRSPSPWAGAAAVAAVMLAGLFVWPRAPDDGPDERAVRLATYNIHYGYDETWGFQLAAQAEAIRGEGVDLIALQEVDTGRMTSYMADDAYFLARRLGMREAYQPTVEHLTGIAVLYRGEGVNIEHLLLTSLQEQTGILRVEIDVAGRPMNLFGLWLGLSDEDTQRQIDEALAFVGHRSPAALGGDFNAQPGSPVYQAVRAAGWLDPFPALGIDPAPLTSPAVHPTERIDYVFLRGVSARQASVSTSLASDHRMVVVEVDLTLPPLPGLARR